MIAEEFVQMPNSNLAKSIYNKWLLVSGNKGGDLYVAIVDDYIWAIFQVVAYYQFWKGGVGGDGLAKKNSNFDALNVVFNELVTLLYSKRVFSTCSTGKSFALVVHTSKVLRCSDRRSTNLILPLESTKRPTSSTLSIFLVLALLNKPHDLMLHLCLPSSSNPLRQC